MAQKTSSTTRALKGAMLPSLGVRIPVREIVARGQTRTIIFENGQRKTVSVAALAAALQKNIATKQRNIALASIRPAADGRSVLAKVGGEVKGEVRQYKNRKTAEQAIDQKYNLADGPKPFGNALRSKQSGDFRKMQEAFRISQGARIRPE